MTLDDTVRATAGLTVGRVYGVELDGYTFRGTYAGVEGDSIILRTGKKWGPEGTKEFDRQELPRYTVKHFYPV